MLPIFRLPPEILVDVFKHHRDQFGLPWMSVAHVSHAWRAIALADPLLWNCINLGYLKGVEEMVNDPQVLLFVCTFGLLLSN